MNMLNPTRITADMKVYELHSTQQVAANLNDVFSFFRQPENLQNLTPDNLRFQLLTPIPIQMNSGRIIEYAIRIFGIPQRWTTIITAFEPPHCFVDEALRSPYSFWHHTHRFIDTPGGTTIIDEVRYALPFGTLGRMIHRMFIRKQLILIFNYRRQLITQMFGEADS